MAGRRAALHSSSQHWPVSRYVSNECPCHTFVDPRRFLPLEGTTAQNACIPDCLSIGEFTGWVVSIVAVNPVGYLPWQFGLRILKQVLQHWIYLLTCRNWRVVQWVSCRLESNLSLISAGSRSHIPHVPSCKLLTGHFSGLWNTL
jgi:hypothetical protein